MSNKFSNYLVDSLTQTQIQDMYNLVEASKNPKSEQYQEESDNSEQIISSITKSMTNELEHIALPGYSYREIEKLKSSVGSGINLAKIKPQSIEKQEAIQNVLINHFQLEENQITVLTEGIEQSHLNYKYSAYYAIINEKGILIVLNDQYAQAGRIKRIETINDAELQLSLLIRILENKDKKTMDEIQGFESFNNTYTSLEDLEGLYIRKINEHLIIASPVINLTGSAEDIWKQVKGQNISYRNREYAVNSIHDFLKLPITVIAQGKIGSTPVREIINAMLGLEDEKLKFRSTEKEFKNKINMLTQLVIKGELGEQAKLDYKAYLKAREEEIDLTRSAEEIWKQVKEQTIVTTGYKDIKINTIQDFIKLQKTFIIGGKIGSTPVREIINSILGLEESEKITSHHTKKTGKANKLRVENAINLLKNKVLEGDLGEEAKVEYEEYINNEKAEEIWKQVKGQTIKANRFKDKKIESIQDFLDLPITVILKGKIGNTLVREIINTMLGLEEEEKITYHQTEETGKANKLRVENARNLLEQKVLEGGLGEKAQKEMQTLIEAQNIQTQIREEIEEI